MIVRTLRVATVRIPLRVASVRSLRDGALKTSDDSDKDS